MGESDYYVEPQRLPPRKGWRRRRNRHRWHRLPDWHARKLL